MQLVLLVALAASRADRDRVGLAVGAAGVAGVRDARVREEPRGEAEDATPKVRSEATNARPSEAAAPLADAELVWGMPRETLAGVMGPLGCALAIVMFLSAGPVAYKIWLLQGVGEFSCFPYTMQVGNCSLWVVYALSDPTPARREDMFVPLLCNAVGVALAGSMWLWFVAFADRATRTGVLLYALPVFVSIAGFAAYVFSTAVEHDDKGLLSGPRKTAAYAAGMCCLVVNILMYMGPLAGIKSALETRSTQFLPLSLGVTTLLCSTPWFLFGLGIGDMPVWLPNACGIVFGLAQILIYAYVQRLHGKGLGTARDLHVDQAEEPLLQRVSTVGNLFDLGRALDEPAKRRTQST